MKSSSAFVLAATLAAAPAFAQSKPPVDVPPPPGMNDPGVRPSAPAPASPAAAPAHGGTSLLPVTPAPIKSGQPLPEVSVHRQGENTVQEYRRNGQLYMVVVTPPNGVAQTYMVDPSGRLVDEHGQKPARPVMYKILEWGKSKPAPAASAGNNGD
ncbi:MAG: DUF2782 domain-containing protein [Frateuria sp.]|uniref:DUF2782 domain-containing protein n=1 Tax=Frateuria sp. TaxID=2211372 RepID=UPI00178EC29B|nr:DUF2782 domain-containing protein [Frateuria sp.]NUO74264.1 DUF2782 domain-containing protein [Frateuria sp.]NUR22935.1 DUF2782 domain-containing protein [Frateuria sp.]